MKALATIYSIKGPWKGQLAIVPRPRGGDWLEDELRSWEEGGLDLIASSLLVLRGTDPEEALNRVATARGRAVPDTSEQRQWVNNFARYLPAATIRR